MLILLFKTINTINNFEYKNITAEAEKMAQWQRTVAFPGDQSSTICKSCSKETETVFWPSQAHGAQIYT